MPTVRPLHFELGAIDRLTYSYWDHLSNQKVQVFSGTHNAKIISLNNALFLDWLFDYEELLQIA